MNTRLVIFAKAPRAGSVKTRLIPALGADAAARLAQQLLLHTLAQADTLADIDVELCVSPAPADVAWQPWRTRHRGVWSDQGAGDLGARMARAAQRALSTNPSVLLIGTDCPALDARQLRGAAASLQRHDACLIPAHDGGYVLLGLRRFDPALFSGLAWSTSGVARETLARLAQLGWTVQTFAPLHDIDEPDDLPHVPGGWGQIRLSPEPMRP